LRVLGPVEVAGDGDGARTALAPKARQLLTLLALSSPRAVPIDELAELLWDDPPPAATKSIQAHVSRIRTAIGEAGAIELTGVGYALRASQGSLDLDVLAEHRANARALRDRGRHDDAAAELSIARALWRGQLELPATRAALAIAAHWDREHLLLVDEHLSAVVDGSHPLDAVSELERWTSTDPLAERRWVLLVRALHRGGDARGALRAYQAARNALVEVGLDVGPELRAAEAAALAGPAAALAGPSESPAAAPHLSVRFADTGAGRVAYVVIGDRPVDTVVLNPAFLSIDGIAQQPRLVDALTQLASRGGVVCLDRRGIGLSDPVLGLDAGRSPSIDDAVADVEAVLGVVGTRPIVLACSDTALVALALAARHPQLVRGLVLVHGYAKLTRGDGYPFGIDPETAASTSADVLDVDDAAAAFDPVAHIAPSAANDREFREWFDSVGRRAASPSVAAALHQVILTADARDLLANVRVPVLLLHRRSCGSCDVGHARYLAEHLPDATLCLLPGADELWFVGDTAGLIAQVEGWIALR
jgi:pimeloyl-ACP methyl ester carboxylesterase/DNA-binding SARP family transcriptional activator